LERISKIVRIERTILLDYREQKWNKRLSGMESEMITFTEHALIGLAAIITSFSALIWSIRRRA